ncbi:MAG: hypothetical protein JW888_00400 [Pirellulales bacterium]|nr:hypothetical protein [Pirellulales bacterium]
MKRRTLFVVGTLVVFSCCLPVLAESSDDEQPAASTAPAAVSWTSPPSPPEAASPSAATSGPPAYPATSLYLPDHVAPEATESAPVATPRSPSPPDKDTCIRLCISDRGLRFVAAEKDARKKQEKDSEEGSISIKCEKLVLQMESSEVVKLICEDVSFFTTSGIRGNAKNLYYDSKGRFIRLVRGRILLKVGDKRKAKAEIMGEDMIFDLKHQALKVGGTRAIQHRRTVPLPAAGPPVDEDHVDVPPLPSRR